MEKESKNSSQYPVTGSEKEQTENNKNLRRFPFEIRGPLKCTPKQAKRMFNFKMKEGATGITFVKRHSGKIIIKNRMPYKPFHGIPQKNKEIIFSAVNKIVSEHLRDIVRPIWNTPGIQMGISGHNLFVRENMKLLEEVMKKEKRNYKDKPNLMTITKWEKMKVSTGALPKPVIKIAEYYFPTGKRFKFLINNPYKYNIGFCLLDRYSLELTHIPPESYKCPIRLWLEKNVHMPVVYAYFTDGKTYSDSSGVIPKSVNG